MKVSKEEIREYIIRQGLSYRRTAEELGVSSSAVYRAAKKYGAEVFIDGFESTEEAKEIKEIKEIDRLNHLLDIERQKVQDLLRGLGRHVSIRECDSEFKIALISDTHYGSLYHDAASLKAFLEYAAGQKVVEILHAGDVLEGEHMHFGQERELSHAGFTGQLEAIKELYPDVDIPVRFITGNHDMSYRKAAGINVGQAISDLMGWEFLGDSFGEVKYSTPDGDYRIGLLHPGGGSAYALSYKLQKIIEQWEGGKKPDTLVAGHFHKSVWLPHYRNVSGIHPGCFQRQTPFMASKGLAAHLDGWILKVRMWKQGPKAVTAECVSFY